MVYILIQIDNITFIHRYKVCYFCQYAWFVRAVQQPFGWFYHPKMFFIIFQITTFSFWVRKNNDLLQNNELFEQEV